MLFDHRTLDTTPGAQGPHATFAPPASFEGDDGEYVRWLQRARKETDIGTHFLVLVRLVASPHGAMPFPTVMGPHANALQNFLERAVRAMRDRRARMQPSA